MLQRQFDRFAQLHLTTSCCPGVAVGVESVGASTTAGASKGSKVSVGGRGSLGPSSDAFDGLVGDKLGVSTVVGDGVKYLQYDPTSKFGAALQYECTNSVVHSGLSDKMHFVNCMVSVVINCTETHPPLNCLLMFTALWPSSPKEFKFRIFPDLIEFN
jgi:hypothetical protein